MGTTDEWVAVEWAEKAVRKLDECGARFAETGVAELTASLPNCKVRW